MGSALLDTTPASPKASPAAPLRAGLAQAPPAVSTEKLRQQVAERLAAHRSRRGLPTQPQDTPQQPARSTSRSAQIAAAVAERYAQQQTYHSFLAAEAERAVQQARAAAEIAAINARAVAEAQQELLQAMQQKAAAASAPQDAPTGVPAELNLWPDLEPEQPAAKQTRTAHRAAPEAAEPTLKSQSPRHPHSPATVASELTVRLYEDEASAAHVSFSPRLAPGHENRAVVQDDAEARALDDEIEFRRAPVFEGPAGPVEPIPGNLIEFPRQLVASVKARPRYAEGPLREEEPDSAIGQLRIFEVDPALISTAPVEAEAEAVAPQWTSIWLDQPAAQAAGTAPHGAPETQEASRETQFADVASVPRRILAAAVNGSILVIAGGVFTAMFLKVAGISIASVGLHSLLHPAPGGMPPTMIAGTATAVFALLYLLYQLLFFSLQGATPGMRCARIALCTFDDENPTRRAMRIRIFALLLSACPVGLGFLWATLDEDRLAWHDRVSRMYQRSY